MIKRWTALELSLAAVAMIYAIGTIVMVVKSS